MPEDTGKTIRIPVASLEQGHKVRTIIISRPQGIKALYDVTAKKIITYLFDKAKGWTLASAKEWVKEHRKKSVKEYKEICVDQEVDFIKLAVEYDDGSSESFEPSYGKMFTLTDDVIKDMLAEEAEMQIEIDKAKEGKKSFCPNCGWNGEKTGDGKCPDCKSKLKDKPKKQDAKTKAVCKKCGHTFELEVAPEKRESCEKCQGFVLYTKSEEVEGEETELILIFEGETQEEISKAIEEADKARGDGQGQGGERQGDGGADKCVCPSCGAEATHVKGKPCTEQKCPKCGKTMVGKSEKIDYSDGMEIIKADKARQIVYGVFLWPNKADTDGDIISDEDIEKVAHKFLIEYRDIDEMHKKETLDAEIVESFIAWMDNLEYFGKTLKKGAWAGAIHVNDKKVWSKIEKGEYKGFSVRISGRREPVGEGIEGVTQ